MYMVKCNSNTHKVMRTLINNTSSYSGRNFCLLASFHCIDHIVYRFSKSSLDSILIINLYDWGYCSLIASVVIFYIHRATNINAGHIQTLLATPS